MGTQQPQPMYEFQRLSADSPHVSGFLDLLSDAYAGKKYPVEDELASEGEWRRLAGLGQVGGVCALADDGRMVGFAHWKRSAQTPGQVTLVDIFVQESERRHHVGSELGAQALIDMTKTGAAAASAVLMDDDAGTARIVTGTMGFAARRKPNEIYEYRVAGRKLTAC